MQVVPGSISITAVKDEGPFLLEWIAWQKMLGFDRVLVMHNDCTDHSPQLLQLLERSGVIHQKRHRPNPDKPPQPQAHRRASRTPWVREATWAFVSDVDEFLVIHTGDGSLGALIDEWPEGAEAMAIHWRVFGTDGATGWRDQIVHRASLRAAALEANQNTQFKSLTRHPSHWGWLRSHGPKDWQGPGTWEDVAGRIVLSDLSPLEGYSPDHKPLNGTDRDRVTHKLAQVNHYALQCEDRFRLKKGRKSAAEHLDRYTDGFFTRFDRNEEEDQSALAYRDRFDAEFAALTAIPGVLRLHHLCCADYHVAIDTKLGRDPAQNTAAAAHLAMADALPTHQPGRARAASALAKEGGAT